MKQIAIISLLLIVTVTTSVLSRLKFTRHPDEIDSVENNISAIKEIIPENGALSVELEGVSINYLLYTRYLLIPRQIYYPVIKSDTLLIINDKRLTDSVNHFVIRSRRILWQNGNDQLRYTLICGI